MREMDRWNAKWVMDLQDKSFGNCVKNKLGNLASGMLLGPQIQQLLDPSE